jgi:hypothetical protein
MKTYNDIIGQKITLKWLKKQIFPMWVVLVDLIYSTDGGVVGGTVKYVEQSKSKAGSKAAKLEAKDIGTLVTRGATGGVHLGEVFLD